MYNWTDICEMNHTGILNWEIKIRKWTLSSQLNEQPRWLKNNFKKIKPEILQVLFVKQYFLTYGKKLSVIHTDQNINLVLRTWPEFFQPISMASTRRSKIIENCLFKTDLLVNLCIYLLLIRLLLTSVRSCWFMWTSCDQMRSVWRRNWREKGKELKGWH